VKKSELVKLIREVVNEESKPNKLREVKLQELNGKRFLE